MIKVKDLKQKYGFKEYEFVRFLDENNLPYKQPFFSTGPELEDDDAEKFVKMYLDSINKETEEKQRMRKATAEMLITSGFSFDGYTITKYSGYISGDDAISVDRGLAIFGIGTNDTKDQLLNSLVTIRRNALRELKEAAYALGCNAVIGVDFDYLTLDPQTANLGGGTTYQPYVFAVTANGNAVVIEKNEDLEKKD